MQSIPPFISNAEALVMRVRTCLPLLVLAACGPAPDSAEVGLQVTHVGQTSGTDVLLIAVHPVDEQVVWASGAGGTWLRTTDGGATWQSGRVPDADSLQLRDVHALDERSAWLLSIGEGEQSRIYRTTDGGESWTLQFTNTEPSAFYDCFGFWDNDRALVIGDAFDEAVALLRTAGGDTGWERIPPGEAPRSQEGEGSFAASGTCLTTLPGGHAWIVASNGERGRLMHTPDFGATWEVDTLPITVRGGSGPQSVTFLDPARGMVLGGGYASEPGDKLATFTADGGATWSVRTRPPLPNGVWGGVYVPGAEPPTVVAVGPDGAVYTRDDGTTWTVIDTLNYWSVGFASPRAGWAVGRDGRITKLTLGDPAPR